MGLWAKRVDRDRDVSSMSDIGVSVGGGRAAGMIVGVGRTKLAGIEACSTDGRCEGDRWETLVIRCAD